MLSRICLECDHANAPDAKFCSECGSPLQVKLCKHCHKANDYAAHFCQGCGRTLPVVDAAHAGEPARSDSAAAAPAVDPPSPLFASDAPSTSSAAAPRPDEATIVRAFSGVRAATDSSAFAAPPPTVIEPVDAAPLVLDPPPGYRPPMVIRRDAEPRPRRATPAWLLGASVVVLIASVLVLSLDRRGAPIQSPSLPSSTAKPAVPPVGSSGGGAPAAASSGAAPAAAVIAVEPDKPAAAETTTKSAAESGTPATTPATPAPTTRTFTTAGSTPAAAPAARGDARKDARPDTRACTQDLAVLGLCTPSASTTPAAPNRPSTADPTASPQERP